MNALTLDQVHLFLAVVDEGSFTRAARTLNRAQSAVTYGIGKLEAQTGLALFDRAAYRPTLTEAGRTLLTRARRIAEEASAFRDTARGLASGLEPELALVVDTMFPMSTVADALRAFAERFPTVPPRIDVQPLGAAVEKVRDGSAAIGLSALMFGEMAAFRSFPMLTVDLVPVVAASHPLAGIEGTIETHALQAYVQMVLTDRSTATAGRDYGVLSSRSWRMTDLDAKRSMLLAGLGWGNMPAHLVEDDIARGRLKRIEPTEFDRRAARVAMGGVHLAGRRLGPAGEWMIGHLAGAAGSVSGART